MSESAALSRLRRRAAKHGCRIMKSRVRNPQAFEYGTMMLVDNNLNAIVCGPWGYFTQEDIEEFVDRWDSEAPE